MEGRRPRSEAQARGFVAALIATCALAVGAGAAPDEVGFVESFEGAADGYAIERAGARHPVFVLAPLEAGDRVLVEEEAGRITLRIGSGAAKTIDATTAPFTVAAEGTGSTLTRNVVAWLGDWMQGNEPGAEAGGVSLVTRGGLGLAAPLLGVDNRIVAGDRPLDLAWTGGAPPVRVTLVDAAGVELYAGQSSEGRLRAAPLALVPGTVQLTLRDANGIALERRLEVRDAAPEPPPDLVPPEAPAALAALLEATWLAGVDHGAWRLEAYRRAAAPADYAPADALRSALAAGATPTNE